MMGSPEGSVTTRGRRPQVVAAAVVAAAVVAAVAGIVFAVGRGSVDCTKQPTVAEAVAVLADHPETQRRVEAIGPQVTQVAAGPSTDCPGRGAIEILYGSGDDVRRIRDVLGPSFHGVPYRLVNF